MSLPAVPAVMLQGTGSDVGKTVLAAGLCRLFANRGLRVRPFKPQNMSNNAAVARIPGTAEWGEIGRGQWLQALACRAEPSVHMNPVLLKPQSETGSQVLVQGRVAGTAQGRDYQRLKASFLQRVLESFGEVSRDADLVIAEGAGSPAEVNLRANDIANMGFARAAEVPAILVGDIDRGGVIASLVGTHAVLDEADRAMIRGFLVNKFRGDPALFDDGLATVTRFTGWPSLGVVPHLAAASRLPAEDSVALERLSRGPAGGLVVAVPVLGRIANFDDLDPLRAEPGVSVVFVQPGTRFPAEARLAVIPGSKATVADLEAFRRNGWTQDLAEHLARGGHVVGLCGGFQMLGRRVADPQGIEGPPRAVEGLGLLDVETVMEPEKVVRETRAVSADGGVPLAGYEIHLGRTEGPDRQRPVALVDGRPEGATSADGRVFGTYLHGIFANDAWRRALLVRLGLDSVARDHLAGVDAALDEIAAALERALDVGAILRIAESRRVKMA
ncbi:cobyric acid synthase [Aureimonas leprariae]|uniref:Cobyric acid synthase n=1 Tax=Plantimonas leprariae TaxID=2615207 RepID=A0A7V7TW62_9HYPH|nr:cobyric acid synthase [Aureimonas leprariae]KAB0679648.1 cobyric acid synthase [Aureimonas leprariae]